MEKENIFLNQSNQNQNDLIWVNFADQSGAGGGVDLFESALSSMVSSPTASNSNASNDGGNVVVRELIGRLGGVCSNGYGSSCYSTPLNSPPKLNLSTAAENNDRRRLRYQITGNGPNLHNNYPIQSLAPPPPFSADPEFAERAARFSCFADIRNLGGGFVPSSSSSASSCSSSRVLSSGVVCHPPMNKEEQAPNSDKKFKTSEPANPDSRENSSNGPIDAKKRKSNARAKPAKDAPSETSETSAKRIKSEENGDAKASEPPKDYIHVRARRGQATDAHSLAERVRREKISERMKFLQDLVPGCNKVTGKAVMLDEIINYVQSLQRQVEFLSMKLAAVNPRMDFDVESIASKDVFQQSFGSLPHNAYASDCYPFRAQANLHSSSVPNGSDRFFDVGHYEETVSQISTYMEDDLHSVVQMGFQKNPIPQCFGDGVVIPGDQMKVEQ